MWHCHSGVRQLGEMSLNSHKIIFYTWGWSLWSRTWKPRHNEKGLVNKGGVWKWGARAMTGSTEDVLSPSDLCWGPAWLPATWCSVPNTSAISVRRARAESTLLGQQIFVEGTNVCWMSRSLLVEQMFIERALLFLETRPLTHGLRVPRSRAALGLTGASSLLTSSSCRQTGWCCWKSST